MFSPETPSVYEKYTKKGSRVLRFGPTPALHGATFRGLNEVVEYLVAAGADIDARDFRGRTAYRMAEGAKQSFQFQSWPETAELLKRLGADARLGLPGTVQERLRDVPIDSTDQP